MTTKPGDGERRAVSGYRPQYLVSAEIILQALKRGDLEWIRVADPDAGQVDDFQIGTTARIDAYQVKWSTYPGTVTLKNLLDGSKDERPLITQLAMGWQRLKKLHPERRVIVHLVTNKYPSTSTQGMPEIDISPTPYHLAAFIEQAWNPLSQVGNSEAKNWDAVWQNFIRASGLSDDEFSMFVQDCALDFQCALPTADADVKNIVDLLFDTAAGAAKRVEINQNELLQRLGWKSRYNYRNIHEFPSPQFLYCPIKNTVQAIKSALDSCPGGYLGMFGSPGSGKSTLLTQSLRTLPVRLVRYYAYVPDAQDLSILRGESVNFLQDVTLRLYDAGICRANRPDASDRSALLKLFSQQLQKLGQDYQQTGMKTIILIDGLDHIAREQSPERSLLHDLPLPEAIPDGVYFVVGSQPNGLENLPPRVLRSLQSQERRIEIECLTPRDVYSVTKEVISGLTDSEHKQVFELSNGHPLALIYLLNQLRQVDSVEDRSKLLSETIPYKGDIDEQYWTHWHRIKDDQVLVHTLGLLARVRGAIPLEWIGKWAEKSILQKLQQLFLTYFQKEGENFWAFFHNSFRLFLVEQTAQPLIGQTQDQQSQEYHRELAQLYKDSLIPWQWETLYHLYKAGDYKSVVAIADQLFFRKQVEALRPYESISTDIRLAFKAAGKCRDIIGLLQLTLASAAVDQRTDELEDLPELLLKVSKFTEAIEHLRDGNRLRSNPEQALRLSLLLHEAGLLNEGKRIFELAEPLELLSGRTISQANTSARDIQKLLSAWIQSAIIFRGHEEVISVVQRVQIEPDRSTTEASTVEETSKRLRVWLLSEGALTCCDRTDHSGWQLFFSTISEQSSRKRQFIVLLQSAQIAYRNGEGDYSRSLLHQVLNEFQLQEIDSFSKGEEAQEVRLDITELILVVTNNKALAQIWMNGLVPIPLEDENISYHDDSTLYERQFRYAKLCYLIDQSREPKSFRDEAELHTQFNTFTDENERQNLRVHALAIYQLARWQALGNSGFYLEPSIFIREIRWILELIGTRSKEWERQFSLGLRGRCSWVLRNIIAIAAVHGQAVIDELVQELERRWTDSSEASAWPLYLQREAIVELSFAGAKLSWSAKQLRRIEPAMLKDLDPRGRAEACKLQAEAWLVLKEKDAAIAELQRMMQAARGVVSEKDYQLQVWVEWLHKVNKLEPERAEDRLFLMLKRILSIHGSASGVVDAAEELLGVMFQQSPRRAVLLLKGFLELHILGYQGGMTRLLKEVLNSENPPVVEALHTIADLVLPFMTDRDTELIEALIITTADELGAEAAFDAAIYLNSRIRVCVLSKFRPACYRSVVLALQSIGYDQTQSEIDPVEMIEPPDSYQSNQLDRRLHLNNGEQLEPDEVLLRVQSITDFQIFIKKEDERNTRYFHWDIVVEHLSKNLVSSAEIEEVNRIVISTFSTDFFKRSQLSRMLLALSKRSLGLGDRSLAWNLAEQALSATEATGWDSYFDGGARYKVLNHLITIDSSKGRDIAISLYAEDGSKGHISTSRVLLRLDETLELFTHELPITKIWLAVEEYLEELFSGVFIEPELPLEIATAMPYGLALPDEDTPARAIADLLTIHLDHPCYPIIQGAMRACFFTLVQGSEALVTALMKALTNTEQSTERALIVLDAASIKDPDSIGSFNEILEQLRTSPNFLLRLIAGFVLMQYASEAFLPQTVTREISTIYALELPSLSIHRTERVASQGRDSSILIEDLARKIRPFDIEARIIADIADISEDNVMYQAVQYFRTLETKRSWLVDENILSQEKTSRFLDAIGLRYTFRKPQIEIARHSLAYVAADLYDGGFLAPNMIHRLSHVLIHHDPAFIQALPLPRPSYIAPIGGIINDNSSFDRLPENWVESAKDSLNLLSLRTTDKRIVLGEWTQLRYLDRKSPEEERISIVRAIDSEQIWTGFDLDMGHRPFSRFIKYQVADYPRLHESLDQLIVASDGYSFDTPGSFWIALNPAIAKSLGWSLVGSGWFRWINQSGEQVAESVWWEDGSLHHYSEHEHCEVAGGWLVLVTEEGFEEIKGWANCLSRGVLVERSLGQHGNDGRGKAMEVLSIV
jgi:hypothetical protein